MAGARCHMQDARPPHRQACIGAGCALEAKGEGLWQAGRVGRAGMKEHAKISRGLSAGQLGGGGERGLGKGACSHVGAEGNGMPLSRPLG